MPANKAPHGSPLRINWLIVSCLLSVLGFCHANQIFFNMQARGMDHSYLRVAIYGIVCYNVWTPLTPLLFWVNQRLPLERPALFRSLALHLPLLLVVAVVVAAGQAAVTMGIRPFDMLSDRRPFFPQFKEQIQGGLPYILLVYSMIAGVGHALEYRRKFREREVHAARVEALLAQAQVLSLRMQLHPHFLFNTLNGVVALMREGENQQAINMLLGLSTMLRYALDSSGRQEVTLSEEIEFLNLYLGVERMRFSDRLNVVMDLDPQTLNAKVPNLLLQPLVENAIRHGIAGRACSGTVTIRSTREGSSLVVEITDDGPGLPATWELESQEGIGLSNTKSRLRQLYGTAQSLALTNRAGGGTLARVTLPFTAALPEPVLTA